MKKLIKKTKNNPMIAELVHADHLDEISGHLRALAHLLRLQILDYIDKNPSTSVNNIYNSLGLEQSITSQHLRILRNSELVTAKREGKQILYSLNYKWVEKLNSAIKNFLN
jgi:ArsR family transcriptional regulator